MKFAVIYTRVSNSRTSATSEACEAQESLCRQWCNSQQMTVLSVHKDQSISGAKTENRPGLDRAMTEAIKHKGVLVVYSLSRLARSLRDCLRLVDALHQKKADFASVKEQIDTSSPAGELIFHIFAALSEFERKQTSQRTSECMLAHQAEGRRMSDLPPYGYQVDQANPKRLIPYPPQQRIMRFIVSWRNQGMILQAISDKLNEGGDKFAPRKVSGQDSKWSYGRVQLVLKRAAAEGLYKKSQPSSLANSNTAASSLQVV